MFEEAVLEKRPEGLNAVLPRDFFTFLNGAGVVSDGDLAYFLSTVEDARGDLGAELEPVALERDGLDEVCAESFVGGGLVGDMRAWPEEVDGGGEHPVDESGEEGDVAVVAEVAFVFEAGPVDDVRDA